MIQHHRLESISLILHARMDETHQVACYAGAKYPERPRAFWWAGERLAVRMVVASSRTPEEIRFHVRTQGEREFVLTYSYAADRWRIGEA